METKNKIVTNVETFLKKNSNLLTCEELEELIKDLTLIRQDIKIKNSKNRNQNKKQNHSVIYQAFHAKN